MIVIFLREYVLPPTIVVIFILLAFCIMLLTVGACMCAGLHILIKRPHAATSKQRELWQPAVERKIRRRRIREERRQEKKRVRRVAHFMRCLRRHYGQWATWMLSSRLGRALNKTIDVLLALSVVSVSAALLTVLFLVSRLLFIGLVYGGTFFLVTVIFIFPACNVLLATCTYCRTLERVVRASCGAFRQVMSWTIQGFRWWRELTSLMCAVAVYLDAFLRRAWVSSVFFDILVARLPAVGPADHRSNSTQKDSARVRKKQRRWSH